MAISEDFLKRLIISAVFRDDTVLELLAFKGGNALDIVFGISDRASRDFDFSLKQDFTPEQRTDFARKFQNSLSATLEDYQLCAYDFEFEDQPPETAGHAGTLDFWGGYRATFKIVAISDFEARPLDKQWLGTRALKLGVSPEIKIEISKHEYLGHTERKLLDGLTIVVCSPLVIVAEKFRAACQQLPEYRERVRSHTGSGRARDLYDVEQLIKSFRLELTSSESRMIFEKVFEAKSVPLSYLGRIEELRNLYEADYSSLKSIVRDSHSLPEFDTLFKKFSVKANQLHTLWVKNSPTI